MKITLLLILVPVFAFAAHDVTVRNTEVRLEKTAPAAFSLNKGVQTEAALPDADGNVRVMIFMDLQKKNDFPIAAKSKLFYQRKLIGTSLTAFDLGSIWDE